MSLLAKLLKTVRGDNPVSAKNSAELTLRAAYNERRKPAVRHSACLAPSVNMIFSEDGAIKVCCHNRENLLGRYPENNIREIWNGDKAKQFREKMKGFEFLSGCWVCTNDYKKGHFDQMPATYFDGLPPSTEYPTMMEFMLSNTCNLECVMCSGELSSSIRQNREKLPPIKSPYGPEFLDELQEFIPHLRETRFSSAGEAFLIDMNFKLWEALIEKSPTCVIMVQTNGTVLNARIKNFLERGNFHMGVSLDSLQKETFESIRVNASFNRVMENIAYFAEYSNTKGRPFNISACIMRKNWKEMPDYIRFGNSIGALIIFHKVWHPQQFALHNLPANELQVIYQELATHTQTFPTLTAIEKQNKRQYEYYLSVIEGWMNDAMNKTDDERNSQNLTLPELRERIKLSFEDYISTQPMIEDDRQQLINLCADKINSVANLCITEQQERAWFLLLNANPPALSFPAIKTSSPEKLYEILCNQVTEN